MGSSDTADVVPREASRGGSIVPRVASAAADPVVRGFSGGIGGVGMVRHSSRRASSSATGQPATRGPSRIVPARSLHRNQPESLSCRNASTANR